MKKGHGAIRNALIARAICREADNDTIIYDCNTCLAFFTQAHLEESNGICPDCAGNNYQRRQD